MIVGVIGCGSIGKRHINNLIYLKKKLSIKKILIYDPDKESLKKYYSNQSIEICENEKIFFIKSNAVIISSPNHLHSKHALSAVKNDCHSLIEKPFSHNIKLVNQVISIAKKKNLVIMTGYMLRYYKPLIETKKIIKNNLLGKIYFAQINCGIYLPNWRPHLDYRKNYGAKKSQGGGVVLDIIHEINYARWLFGNFKSVSSYINKLSNLKINTEDFASINLISHKNVFINLTLDYLNQSYNRNFNIVGEKGSLRWNFLDHNLEIYKRENKKWKSIIKLKNYDFNQTYLDEITNFILSCSKKQKQKISNLEGLDDLKIVLSSFKANYKEKTIKLKFEK